MTTTNTWTNRLVLDARVHSHCMQFAKPVRFEALVHSRWKVACARFFGWQLKRKPETACIQCQNANAIRKCECNFRSPLNTSLKIERKCYQTKSVAWQKSFEFLNVYIELFSWMWGENENRLKLILKNPSKKIHQKQ